MAAAATAKAAMVLVIANESSGFPPHVAGVALPTVGLSQAEGNDLVRRLGQGKVTLDLHGIAYSPYTYTVVLPFPQVPDGISHTMDPSNTAHQHTKVYAVRPNQIGFYGYTSFRPYDYNAFSVAIPRPFGYSQDRYYSANDTRYASTSIRLANDWIVNPVTTYTPGQEVTKTYYKAPMRAGTSTMRAPAVRDGDQLKLPFDSLVDQEPDHINAQPGRGQAAARIYRDGELVAEEQIRRRRLQRGHRPAGHVPGRTRHDKGPAGLDARRPSRTRRGRSARRGPRRRLGAARRR